jgi:hypothetical protein
VRRLALLAGITAVAAGLGTVGSLGASGHPTATATPRRCETGSEQALINGKWMCLRAGKRCARRFDRQYHRYGFHCHTARLRADLWVGLENRPLRLPHLAPGAACPSSTGRIVNPNFGPAYGSGPVYAAMGGSDGTVNISNAQQVNGWYGMKVLWITDPHRAKTLIRGHQINGPRQVRFDTDAGIVPELRLDRWGTVSGSSWGHRPSTERVQATGCYALQADGKDFSTVVVFEAVP